MRKSKKVTIGMGLVGSMLLFTILLTGKRKAKTKKFLINLAKKLSSKITDKDTHDSESYYV